MPDSFEKIKANLLLEWGKDIDLTQILKEEANLLNR